MHYFDDYFWPIALEYSRIHEGIDEVLGRSTVGISEPSEVTCNDTAQRSSKSRSFFRRQRWTLNRLFQLGSLNGNTIRSRCCSAIGPRGLLFVHLALLSLMADGTANA